jgi:hypothetical protein
MFYLTNRVLIVLVIAVVCATPVFKTKVIGRIKSRPELGVLTQIVYLALFAACIVFVVADSYNPFIYFRF